ncbi:DUF6177 family protein [Nocardiopsis dassonvillei]|uniref:DUF6177 family protein n=1 Tax=Nocardiopsis dassonvillei TaxID=2014 RepID=UPI000B9D7414|nr:DUF6177 family protein [Nocardiopsis dassonvillei]ASU60865.1 hypothetical protein CGQ36_26390 [Nocardiopsis dassonvillei]
MSYDVVALVADEPDEKAVVHALGGVDPELRLHWHGDTRVLQIRDGDAHLLATLEPGQPVERSDAVVRLLGPEVVAGLPETFWWVETRARPDERGREVAHRFADGLALRLGGAVWTSGQADFGLWEESEHPAVERTATKALLVAQDRAVVPFSSWLSDAMATHVGERTLQVLTPPTARLTYAVRTFAAGTLGRWVVRCEDGGHYDGITGLPVRWDDEQGFRADREPVGLAWAAGHPDAEPVSGFLADHAESAGTQIVVDVSVLHGDPFTPDLGRVAEVVSEHVAGTAPSAWGPHEPALMAWDRDRMAGYVRERGSRPSILYLSGPLGEGRPFSGQLHLARRGSRVLERVSVVTGFENGDAVPSDAFPALVEALAAEGLLDGLRVRRVPGRADVTYAPVWAGPVVPVGLAVGPDRLRRIGTGRAQAGPIPGTLVGEDGARAVWYPVVEDAVAPLRALDLMRRQTEYLSAASAKRA